MKITIETIPHSDQRYATAGDWEVHSFGPQDPRPHIRIRVSKMSSLPREMAVAVHELVEALGCVFGGISQAEVDRFDMAFKGRGGPGEGEPGDDRKAPYYPHHQFASGIERLCAHEWGIDWNSYNDEIERLGK